MLGRLSETWRHLTDATKQLWRATSAAPRRQFIGANLNNARAGRRISHTPAYTDTLPPPPPVAPDDAEPLAWRPPHVKFTDATGVCQNQPDSGPPVDWDDLVVCYEWDDGETHYGILRWNWHEHWALHAATDFEFHWIAEPEYLAGRKDVAPYYNGTFVLHLFYPDLPVPTALAQWHAITLSWQTLKPETRVECAADWLTLIYAAQSEEPPEPALINLAAVVPTAAARVRQSHTLTHLTPGVPYTFTLINAAPNGGTSYPVHVGPITPT